MKKRDPLQQCAGGWCTVREKCAHYWAKKQPSVPPSERLCIPNEDGEAMTLRPIDLVRTSDAQEQCA